MANVGRDGCRQGAKDAPPQDSKSKHSPGTKAIGEPSCGSLEERIPEKKCAEDKAEADVADAELLGDLCARDGKIHPVEKRDGTQDKKQEDEKPAYVACRL